MSIVRNSVIAAAASTLLTLMWQSGTIQSLIANFHSFRASHPIKFTPDAELLMFSGSFIIMYANRIKKIRKNKWNSSENIGFMITVLLGILLGLFIDVEN